MEAGMEDPVEARRKVLNRLKRARGQLNAVIENFENEGECKDVVTQLSAVTAALDRAGFAIIANAMKSCLTKEGPEAHMTPEEVEKLFLSLA